MVETRPQKRYDIEMSYVYYYLGGMEQKISAGITGLVSVDDLYDQERKEK